jgi:hypothetical protein
MAQTLSKIMTGVRKQPYRGEREAAVPHHPHKKEPENKIFRLSKINSKIHAKGSFVFNL